MKLALILAMCATLLPAAFAGEESAAENEREAVLALRRYLAAQGARAALSKKFAAGVDELVGAGGGDLPLPWYKVDVAFAAAEAPDKALRGYYFVRLARDSTGAELGEKRHALAAVPAIAGSRTFLAVDDVDADEPGGFVWSRDTEGQAPDALPADPEADGWVRAEKVGEKPEGELDPGLRVKIEKLITELGSGEFATREKASQELEKLGAPAILPLTRAAKESADPEVVQRAENVLAKLGDLVASESGAVAHLRKYAMAQSMYRRNDWDGDGALEYACPFSLLYSQRPRKGGPIKLTSEIFSRATSPRRPVNGYFFMDAVAKAGKPLASKNGSWVRDYALCAVPARYGGDTKDTLIITTGAAVYARDTGGRPVFSFPGNALKAGWTVVR